MEKTGAGLGLREKGNAGLDPAACISYSRYRGSRTCRFRSALGRDVRRLEIRACKHSTTRAIPVTLFAVEAWANEGNPNHAEAGKIKKRRKPFPF